MPKVTNHLDLQQKQLKNAVIDKQSTAPSTPVAGQIYYNTGTNSVFIYDGTGWDKLNDQAMSAADILTAIKTVDGAGSGLDADLLDNLESTHFLDRANHSGSQLASTISNLATTVKGYRLDEFAAPTASVSLNSQKITNLGTPTADTDASTKGYVDTKVQLYSQGLDPKASVVTVATSEISPISGLPTIGGVSLYPGARVLLTAQGTASQNGIYVAEENLWNKATDATGSNLTKGAHTFNEADGSGWVYVGGTNEVWTKFSEGSAVSAGTGISVSTSGLTSTVSLDTANGYGVRKYSTSIGDGSANPITVTHSLNTEDVTVQVREASGTKEFVLADVAIASANAVTITFDTAPTSNQYRVVVIG